jgi:ferredoxin
MAIVKIFPSGVVIEVEPGANLLQAALDNNLAWANTCGGKAQCTTCAYVLLEGLACVSPINRLEKHQLVARKGRYVVQQRMRLACQTIVKGDIVVRKTLMALE